MLAKITKEELELVQVLSHPISCAEILFHDFDNLGSFDEEHYGDIRKYQYHFLSYDSLFFEDKSLSKKANFQIKKGFADSYVLGGRLTGKSLFVLIVDVLTCTFNKTYNWAVVSSLDAIHIRGVMEKILIALENHPVFRLFNPHPLRSPAYKVTLDNGCLLESVNNNIVGKNPGNGWFGKHVDRNWEEESAFITSEVTNKKLMAQSELGCVERFCIKEGTKILLSNFSSKNIEDIVIGDSIIAWNEEKNCLVETEVLNLFDSGIKDVMKITDNSNELWLTPEHKIRCISKGDNVYKWREAYGCLRYDYFAKSINYVENTEDYLKGVLVGILESDGSHYKFKGEKEELHQFIIHQSDEVFFIEWLLNQLQISFTKTEIKKHGWNKKQPYRFNINRINNDYILNCYNSVENKKDAQYGFLIGFVIGDGYLGDNGSLSITQSNKANKAKVDKIREILNKLKLKYCENYRESNKSVQFYINKYELPFYEMPCNKGNRYKNLILNKERPIFNKLQIKCKGYLESQQVYDIETECHSFIANGFIVHNSGMTTFPKISPMGKIFYDLKNESKIVNLPSYVNPTWDENKEEASVLEFGGKNSLGYQVQIMGKIVETGDAVFDIDRIRSTYKKETSIKAFEIDKNNYYHFKDIIVVEKPVNATQTYICLDKGEGAAPSEIVVLFLINDIYNYRYNITTFKLAPDEDEEVISFLIEQLQANVVGIDYTSGGGKALFCSLSKKYPGHIVPVSFNEKIDIDFLKDEHGNMIYDNNGKLQYKREGVVEWSVYCLKQLFYTGRISCLMDTKLDKQLDGVVVMRSGSRTIYGYKVENHLFQAFQVFAICDWLNAFKSIQPVQKRKPGMGVSGSI